MASKYSKDLLLTMYRKMYLMRRFEERHELTRDPLRLNEVAEVTVTGNLAHRRVMRG